jgi:hypothetical protein
MRHTIPMSFLFLALPGLALAQGAETQCTYGDMVRRVVIMTEPGVSVAKLEGWGWDCGATDPAAPAAPAARAEPAESAEPAEAPDMPSDTTGDLAPATPEKPDSQ